MRVSDEAVEAAVEEAANWPLPASSYQLKDGLQREIIRDIIEAALEAALPHLLLAAEGDEELARQICAELSERGADFLSETDAQSLIVDALASVRLAATLAERKRAAGIARGFTCGACGMDGKAAAAIESGEP